MTSVKTKDQLVEELIWLRYAQIIVNEEYQSGIYKIPIHLALGHEAIAIAVNRAMADDDALFLTHRNIHYNLIRQKSHREIMMEYALEEEGLAKGRLGSMNLANKDKGIFYTSSILGNNLPVACGYALGTVLRNLSSCAFVITGDGAIEEGAFWESIVFSSSQRLPILMIVENNKWSLATEISERRGDIDLNRVAESVGAAYLRLQGNDVFDYCEQILISRDRAVCDARPAIIEVELATLGSRVEFSAESSERRFINYHAGPIGGLTVGDYPEIDATVDDPLFVLREYVGEEVLVERALEIQRTLRSES